MLSQARPLRSFATLAAAVCLLVPMRVQAEQSGFVYVDENRNGLRDPGEPAVPGAVVTNGRDLVETAADGAWTLPDAGRFVYLTRPAGFTCERWYREDAGDFALLPADDPHDFFFVQISDVHAYDRPEDFTAWSVPPLPWWLPDFLGGWLFLRMISPLYPEHGREGVVAALRTALAPYRAVDAVRDYRLLPVYAETFVDSESGLARVEERIREAFEEVAALEPRLVISTGDLVLESNSAPPDVVERWFRFYREVSQSTRLTFYETIGNNEIAGILNEDFSPEDERYGKHYFREFYGPTHYSFDLGPYHFTALDTHRPAPKPDDPEWWDFVAMSDEVRAWADADLARHSERVLVVLNHEPFHLDPEWPGDYEPARDEGLFARHGVDYVLAGHVHANGFELRDGVAHITTGALSGFRWFFPPTLHPHGYRLFYAHDGELYSAWKQLGQPALGFITPRASPDLAAATRNGEIDVASGDDFDVVAVAVDRNGPFDSITLTLNERRIPFERWGRYFLRARLDGTTLPERAVLRLRAARADGSSEAARVALREPDRSGR